MLFLVLQIVLDPFALQVPRQRFSSARVPVAGRGCTCWRLVLGIVGFFRFRQTHFQLGGKQRELFTRKLLALASRFGLEQLPQQVLGAIQLRRQIHNDFLKCLWIAWQRLGIDGQAQV